MNCQEKGNRISRDSNELIGRRKMLVQFWRQYSIFEKYFKKSFQCVT